MTISEVSQLLAKVQNLAGDVEVVLKDVGNSVETVVHSIGIELGASGDASGSTVTISHGPVPAAESATGTDPTAPADPAEQAAPTGP